MLDCPNCGEQLTPIIINTGTHARLTIDHCIHCGGTWFDHYEINRITLADVYKITGATQIKRNQMPWGKMERLCPKDSSRLMPFKSEITEERMHIERCTSCGGMFIMEKDLERLKMAQMSKLHYYKSNEIPFPSLKLFFIPLFFVGLLLFSTFLTVTKLNDAMESRTRAKDTVTAVTTIPVTGNIETVFFATTTPLISRLEYWTNILDKKTIDVAKLPQTAHSVSISGLSPGTVYSFRIILTFPGTKDLYSDMYTFKTQSGI